MLETNIRVIQPGMNLYVWVRQATVTGPNLTSELIEKSCGVIRSRYHLAAVAHPKMSNTILIASNHQINPVHLDGEDWEMDVTDSLKPSEKLTLLDEDGMRLIPKLAERALLAHISTSTSLWTMDSPRIWYEAKPIFIENGIAAYRRYEIGSIFIKNVGVGIVIDTGVAFFSKESLAYYFDSKSDATERALRERKFMQLIRRQDGQKGTLIYDNGRKKTKCYFVSPSNGMTCATTGILRIKNQSYDSLFDYYKATNPDLLIEKDTPAIRVSFQNMDRPQPVAADHVWVRVMNEYLPTSMRDIDKISPNEKRNILEKFWGVLGPKPLGQIAPGIEKQFWRPSKDQIFQFPIPKLDFGADNVLDAPKEFSNSAYSDHFRNRSQMLKNFGCYQVPPNICRTFYCAYPNTLGEDAAKTLAVDLASEFKKLTKKPMVSQLVGYDNISEAIEQLRDLDQNGMVVFVLNEEPSAYYEAEFQLPGWRIKRINKSTIEDHFLYLQSGVKDKSNKSSSMETGRRRWSGFVSMTALDVIQLLDVTPYRVDTLGPYEGNLIIDVGHDRRFFAVSLLISRPNSKTPGFRIISHTQHKVDHKEEAINPVILMDEITALFTRLPKKFDPLTSLLIIRDGKFVKQEPDGLNNALLKLKTTGYISQDARIDWVEVRKDTQKVIRLWDVNEKSIAHNPLMGTGIRLDDEMVIMVNTGAPTLPQATADPILVVANGHCCNVLDAAQANFSGAQMNWSSPRVAQRLHIGMKRTDEDLKSRSAQEVRRLK